MSAYGLGNAGVRTNKSASGGGITTADNATSVNPAGNVQLGATASGANSPLLHDTYINTGLFTLRVNTAGAATPLQVSSTTVYALHVISTNHYGIYATSATTNAIVGQADAAFAAGIYGQSQDGWGGFFMVSNVATNTVLPVVVVQRQVQGATANGVGCSIDFNIQVSTGSSNISNQISSLWTDHTAASRTSQLIISGVSNAVTADLLTIAGTGAARLNQYGAGTFAGTPVSNLQVDATGNIIEQPAGESIQTATLILTDAQFKALANTGITIIPAPGAGKAIYILSWQISYDFAGGAYTGTGVAANGIQMYKAGSGDVMTNDITIDATNTTPEYLSTLNTGGAPFQWFTSAIENKAVEVWSNLSNNLGGGNAANTCKIIAQYVVIDL